MVVLFFVVLKQLLPHHHWSLISTVIGISSPALFNCAILFLRLEITSQDSLHALFHLYLDTRQHHPFILTKVRMRTLNSCSVSIQVNFCWALPAQSFSVQGLARSMTILYCLTTIGDVQLLIASSHYFVHLLFLEWPCAFASRVCTRNCWKVVKVMVIWDFLWTRSQHKPACHPPALG
jgi:hypothetical protein